MNTTALFSDFYGFERDFLDLSRLFILYKRLWITTKFGTGQNKCTFPPSHPVSQINASFKNGLILFLSLGFLIYLPLVYERID